METKFTKGWWYVDKRASLRVACNNNTIASCSSSHSGDNLDEQQANAKLIATAPDLFKALLSTIQYGLEKDSEDRIVIRLDEEEVKNIWNILKKATE